METTEKIFYSNPYQQRINAKIIAVKETHDGVAYAFDRTIFYPGGGGQLSDSGEISGIKVREVFEENGLIYHLTEKPIHCNPCTLSIDWERRYRFMKMHTGQHLLSALLEKIYGWKTLSSTIQEDHVSIELSTPRISWEEITCAELEAFKLITNNLQVKTYWLNKEEARKLPLRKLVDVGETVRVIEIDGFDYSLCKGTHVNRTSEIGILSVYFTDKVRGNARIYFKAGELALAYFQETRNKIKEIVSTFAFEEEILQDRLSRIVEDRKRLRKKLQKMEKFFSEEKLKELMSGNEDIIYEELDLENDKIIKHMANALLKNGRSAILYSVNTGKVFLSLASYEIEKSLMDFIKSLNPKGGGKNGYYEFYIKDKQDKLKSWIMKQKKES